MNTNPCLHRRLVSATWLLLVTPFTVVAVWLPIARFLHTEGETSAPMLALTGTLAGTLALLASLRGTPLGMVSGALAGAFAGVMISSTGVASALAGGVLASTAAALPPCSLWLSARLPRDLRIATRKSCALLWLIASLFTIFGQSVRTAGFMGDPSFTQGAMLPDDPMFSRHACLTAYVHASILADRAENPYRPVSDRSLAAQLAAPNLPESAAHLAPFTLDNFGYGPPFLVLPAALRAFTEDFLIHRALFALGSLLLAMCAMAALAQQLGGATGRRVWLLAPIGLGLLPVMANVALVNFHLAMVSLLAFSWVAFEREQNALGGGLLAFSSLSKFSPSLLVVVLLAQRRWRAALATLVAAVLICIATLPVVGLQTWVDFLSFHLPRVASGEAVGFFVLDKELILTNQSPFGLPFKLAALGLDGWGWDQARVFIHVYTVGLLGTATLSGLRAGSAEQRAIAWLCLAALASLRSPFAAPFVLCGSIFMWILLSGQVHRRSHLALYAMLGVLLLGIPPLDSGPGIVFGIVHQSLQIGVLTWIALHRWPQT